MKLQSIVLCVASMFFISACTGGGNTSESTSVDDNHRYVTLCLTEGGLLDGQPGGQVGTYFNAVDRVFEIGADLPTAVTNVDTAKTFTGWSDGFVNYTKVPAKGADVLTATWHDANAPTYVDVTTETYSVVNSPAWLPNDNCVIFAWVWGGTEMSDQWIPATIIPSGTTSTLQFDADDDITGFNFARCKAGTAQPDWGIRDKEDHSAGRIYNKSVDYHTVKGTYTYTSNGNTDWMEYPDD